MTRTPFAALLAALAMLLALLTAPTAHADPAPALRLSNAELASALVCPQPARHPDKQTVLLVHGTGGSGAEHYGDGLGPVLTEQGFDWCMVNIPDHEFGDIQSNTEYVVHAMRTLAARTGGKVSVVGYSQGAILSRWAVRWWPDVRDSVDRLISLEGPNKGSEATTLMCAAFACPPAAWQMRPDSKLITALNRVPLPSGPVYTAIGSDTDETIRPLFSGTPYFIPGNARGNILIQDVCPGRVVTHGQAPFDAVAVGIVVQALSSPGPVQAGDVDKRLCDRLWATGVAPGPESTILDIYSTAFARMFSEAPKATREPALRPYAR